MNRNQKHITVLPVGMLQTNCVLVNPPDSSILYIVDPGGDGERIIREAKVFEGITEYRILLTHAHFDHIYAAGQVAEAFGLKKICLHPEDLPLYRSPENAMPPYFPPAENLPETGWFPPEDSNLQILKTPGHTPGGVSYYFPALQTVLAGDTLFYCGIGRTDFPGGSYEEIVKSVKECLFLLPDETLVIAGHGPDTTIGYEKRNNPYIR